MQFLGECWIDRYEFDCAVGHPVARIESDDPPFAFDIAIPSRLMPLAMQMTCPLQLWKDGDSYRLVGAIGAHE